MPRPASTEAYSFLLQTMIAARKKAGVTQSELASRLRKHQSYVSKIEIGERRLDVIEFYAIAKALDLDPIATFASVVERLPESVAL